jgi:hypothetical protein
VNTTVVGLAFIDQNKLDSITALYGPGPVPPKSRTGPKGSSSENWAVARLVEKDLAEMAAPSHRRFLP